MWVVFFVDLLVLILDFIFVVWGMEVGIGWVKFGGGGNFVDIFFGEIFLCGELRLWDRCVDVIW